MALNNLPPPASDRAWEHPIYDYDELAPEPSPPLSSDFQALPRIWLSVWLHPRRAMFEAQVAEASWQRICILLALLGLGSGVLDFLGTLESGHAMLSIVVSSFINSIIASTIFTGIWFWFAKRLGGRGQFMPYMYLQSLVIVPFSLLTELLALVPKLGGVDVAGLVWVAVTMYAIFVLLLATAAAHQFSKRKAALALFAPIGTFMVLLLAGLLAGELLDLFA